MLKYTYIKINNMKYIFLAFIFLFTSPVAFANENKSWGRVQSEHTEHPPHDHQEHDHLKILKDMDKRRKKKSHQE